MSESRTVKIKIGNLLFLLAVFSFLFSQAAQCSSLVNGAFYGTDLREVLRSISDQTGVTIVVDDKVTGTVSLEFNNVPLEKALTMVLSPGGYGFRRTDDYYTVSTPEVSNPAFGSLSSTLIMRPRYVDVSRVDQILSPDLTPYIKTAVGRNVLSITALPATSRKIENIISRADNPPPHIMVEVLAVEVEREEGFNLGIDWSWQWTGKLEESEGISVEGLAIGYTSENILAAINALVTGGEVRILSNPRVLTLDNGRAQLELETEQYFEVLAGPPEAAYHRLETITARNLIEVRPRLNFEGEVILDVQIGLEDLAPQAEPARLTRRNANTAVRVGSGQTVAIAGFSEEIQRQMKTRVWGLGDIPLVNILFSSEYAMQRKTELVIFITPYVLPEELPPVPVVLTAANWGPSPEFITKSEQVSPEIYLRLSGYFGEVQGESQYQVEVSDASFDDWILSAGYGLFEREDYRLSFFKAEFLKEMLAIRGDLNVIFSYRQRKGKPRVDPGEEEFQQNLYSLSLREVNLLTQNLQVMGKVTLTYVGKEGDSSPVVTTFSAGPIYRLGGGLSLSGRYHYARSKAIEYQQQGYAVEIKYSLHGKGWAFTAGYRKSNQDNIEYMVGMEPPSIGYYAGIELSLR